MEWMEWMVAVRHILVLVSLTGVKEEYDFSCHLFRNTNFKQLFISGCISIKVYVVVKVAGITVPEYLYEFIIGM